MRQTLLAVSLGSLILAGCGYQAGQVTGGEGRSIAVPVFLNQTYRRDLERDLTRAVQQEIRSRTGFRLTDESSGPDLILRGRIVEIEESVLSERSRGRIRESSVIVTVVVTVVDTRTGEAIVDKARLVERRPFVPIKGESLRTAEVAALRGLAERIAYSLSTAW